MWLLFKGFQYSDYCKNVISSLESIISEYGNVEEIISDNGKQKVENNPPSSHQSSIQHWSPLLRRQEYAGHDAHERSYHHSYPSS